MAGSFNANEYTLVDIFVQTKINKSINDKLINKPEEVKLCIRMQRLLTGSYMYYPLDAIKDPYIIGAIYIKLDTEDNTFRLDPDYAEEFKSGLI